MDTGQGIQIYSKFLRKNYQRYKKIYHVDLMCVFNKMTSDYYKKFISVKHLYRVQLKIIVKKFIKKDGLFLFLYLEHQELRLKVKIN